MKILVTLPSLGGGGAERLHINIANEWVKSGHEVFLLILDDSNQTLKFLIDPRINTLFLKSKRIRHSLFALRKCIKTTKPDIFFAAMWPLTIVSCIAWILSSFRGKLYLVEHLSFTYENIRENYKTSPYIISFTQTVFYNLATRVICVSEGVRDSINNFSKINSSKMKVVMNGIPIPRIQELQSYKVPKEFKERKINILSIGRLNIQKDYETGINVIKLIIESGYDLNFFIIGEGPEKSKLVRLSKQLKISKNIKFLGFKNNVLPYLVHADVFMHTAAYEGFGLVILEALACSKQIIATDCPHGPSEILDKGKYGKLAPVRDVNQIAAKLTQIIKGDTIDESTLRERAIKFSIENTAKDYIL